MRQLTRQELDQNHKLNDEDLIKGHLNKLQREPGTDVRSDIYRSCTSQLKRAQSNRCSYCECILNDSDPIDHYRPKKKVTGCPDHSGYWWLSYEYDNLLLSCKTCNDKKGNRFDLLDEDKRASKPSDDIENEEPKLLNPYKQDPEAHLYWSDYNVKSTTQQGEYTIGLLKLNCKDNRLGLIQDREKTLANYIYICSLTDDHPENGNRETKLNRLRNGPYVTMLEYVHERIENDGVLHVLLSVLTYSDDQIVSALNKALKDMNPSYRYEGEPGEYTADYFQQNTSGNNTSHMAYRLAYFAKAIRSHVKWNSIDKAWEDR